MAANLARNSPVIVADLLVPRVERQLVRRWPFAGTLSPPPIVLARVGSQAAAVCAALLAHDRRGAESRI